MQKVANLQIISPLFHFLFYLLIYNNSKCILKNREGAIKMLFSYDKTLGTVETSQGTMTLTKVFIPFFLVMF